MAGAVEDHRGDVVDVLAERLGDGLEVGLHGRVDVDRIGGLGADRDLVHVDARAGVEHRAALGDADDRDRVVASERGERRALDRVDGDVDGRRRPSPISSPLKSIGASSFSPSPITTTPSIETVLRTRRMASTAAPSAAFLSPRPIQRPAASAAASVPRTSSMARLRSGACGWVSMTSEATRRARLSRMDPRLLAAARRGQGFMPDDEGLALARRRAATPVVSGRSSRSARTAGSRRSTSAPRRATAGPSSTPSTTTAAPRRTRPDGSTTTIASSTPAPGAWTRCRCSGARSRSRRSRTS